MESKDAAGGGGGGGGRGGLPDAIRGGRALNQAGEGGGGGGAPSPSPSLPPTDVTLLLLAEAERTLRRATTPLATLVAIQKASLLEAQQLLFDTLGQRHGHGGLRTSNGDGDGDDDDDDDGATLCALGASVMIAGGVLFLEQVVECGDPERLALLFSAVVSWFRDSEPPPGIPFGFSRTDLMALCRRKKKDEPAMWTPDTAMCYGALLKQLLKVRVCVIVCVCAFGVGG